jgi:hypothetical protein
VNGPRLSLVNRAALAVVTVVATAGCGGDAASKALPEPPSLASVECPGGMSSVGAPDYAAGKNTEPPEQQAARAAAVFLAGFPDAKQKTLNQDSLRQDIVYDEPDGTRRAVLLFKKSDEVGWYLDRAAHC